MYEPPSKRILEVLPGRLAWTVNDLRAHFTEFVGGAVSSNAIRLCLSRLERTGQVERVDRGVYCAVGAKQARRTVGDWVIERLTVAWPGFVTPKELVKRFYRENRVRLPEERFEAELNALRRQGVVVHHGQGKYGFSSAPEIPSMIQPAPNPAPAEPDIFS